MLTMAPRIPIHFPKTRPGEKYRLGGTRMNLKFQKEIQHNPSSVTQLGSKCYVKSTNVTQITHTIPRNIIIPAESVA